MVMPAANLVHGPSWPDTFSLAFLLALQANVAIVLQTDFLPRQFQFIMHQPVIV